MERGGFQEHPMGSILLSNQIHFECEHYSFVVLRTSNFELQTSNFKLRISNFNTSSSRVVATMSQEPSAVVWHQYSAACHNQPAELFDENLLKIFEVTTTAAVVTHNYQLHNF